MSKAKIEHLIICSPYDEPDCHWKYISQAEQFERVSGRRSAGYIVATPNAQALHDPGVFRELPRVNRVRERVAEWREEDYPGATAITRRLLKYWKNAQEQDFRRLFYCQIEAAETMLWLTEAPETSRAGIVIPSDGGGFSRFCAKMATGTGKTVVMAMVMAWQILNKVASPTDRRFSKHILIVTPGLTVKNRLAVLSPQNLENYYEEFRIVPVEMLDKLRQGRVVIRNWQSLQWESKEKIAKKKGVDKRGPLSDEAYIRSKLGDLKSARNILVVNDEAHHAWRCPQDAKGVDRYEKEMATKWVGILDRIHEARGVLACYDFSATPFTPSGGKSSEEALFGWIVSDFGLNDAIESGLVKTPRVVVRDDGVDDAETYRSKFYHIYGDDSVKDDLNRNVEAFVPLPDLVVMGYSFLSADWLETMKAWQATGAKTRPVMITAVNRTETAARVKHAFDHGIIGNNELQNESRTLHIDSKVLKNAEAMSATGDTGASETEDEGSTGSSFASRLKAGERRAENLRMLVNTVGQVGKPGEHIQNVISVDMLSEGWDAKTVTHIMGLRAFHSQLLCEQVVGRGLRRQSYDLNPKTGRLDPEYVNVFGVPFSFLPHLEQPDVPKPESLKLEIHPVADKARFEISWPNVTRIDCRLHKCLSLDWKILEPIILDVKETPLLVKLAPTVEGNPDMSKIKEIDLRKHAEGIRLQEVIFKAAVQVCKQLPIASEMGEGNPMLIAQVIKLTEEYIDRKGSIVIVPKEFEQDVHMRKLMLDSNMSKIIRHFGDAIKSQNVEDLFPVFCTDRPILSTRDMRPWLTGRKCVEAKKSHINGCVCDSTLEKSEASVLDRSQEVEAWVKNDHLGFEVQYMYNGTVRMYRPDFLIRLASKKMLVLESKGAETEQDRAKRDYLEEWVRAVNGHGGFGQWACDVSFSPGDLPDILAKHMKE